MGNRNRKSMGKEVGWNPCQLPVVVVRPMQMLWGDSESMHLPFQVPASGTTLRRGSFQRFDTIYMQCATIQLYSLLTSLENFQIPCHHHIAQSITESS